MIYAKWALGLTVLIAQQHQYGSVDALRAAASSNNNSVEDIFDNSARRELGNYVPINTCLTEEHCNKARQRMGVDDLYYYVNDL